MEKPALSVIHVTSWLSRKGGGIPPVLWALARETNQMGFPCSVFGLRDEWTQEDCAREKVPMMLGNVVGPKALGYSPGLSREMRKRTDGREIVHCHGLWMYPGMAARKCAGRVGSRFMVSPHGMLEPWALNNSRWKKQLAGRLFENKNLREADCLHALCAAEADNFRSYGLTNPIAIIPNGVGTDDLRPSTPHGAFKDTIPETKGRRCILFLSRLHPKKGLENLIGAWRRLTEDFKDWCVVIAGSGEAVYEANLRSRVRELELDKSVVFLGPVYGSKKKQALAAADVFVLPSFSEGFSMAILEAAAAGLPVLLTRECNFPELAKADAALEISPDVIAIENGLRQILLMSDEERNRMGERGRALVGKFYTWPVIAAQMCRVYQWLNGDAEKPDCVV